MSFSVVYLGGGIVDKVRELPYPHFSKYTIPLVKGRRLGIVATDQIKSDTYSLPFPTEFLSVAFACSSYCDGDYWELTVKGEKIADHIYTKELPESVSMGNSFGIVYPLPPNAEVKFDFYNVSGTAKTVWYNIKFLR